MKSEKRKMYLLFLISLFISFTFAFLFYNVTQKIQKISIQNIILPDSKKIDESYNYNIEKVEIVRNKVFIESWFLEKGKNNTYINRVIVIKDNKDNYYKLFTKSNERPDINEYFGKKYNYNNVGLISKGKLKKEIEYPLKIYFLIKENDKMILIDTKEIVEKDQRIQKISIENFEILSLPKENKLFPYNIETIEVSDNKFFIKGWILKKGEDNSSLNKIIVIKDAKNNYFKLNTKTNLRLDVSELFNEGYDYSKSGRIGEGKLENNLEYPFKIYFLIEKDNKNILIDTGQMIER